LLAAAIWVKVLAAPTVGALADKTGRRNVLMGAFAAAACAAYAGLLSAGSFWLLILLNLVALIAQAALMPLGDTTTLAAVRSESLGSIRALRATLTHQALAGSVLPSRGAGEELKAECAVAPLPRCDALRERVASAARRVRGLPRSKFSPSVVRARRAGCFSRGTMLASAAPLAIVVIAGALYSAFGGGAYSFMAALSAAGLGSSGLGWTTDRRNRERSLRVR
jgi:MFS_1 like family